MSLQGFSNNTVRNNFINKDGNDIIANAGNKGVKQQETSLPLFTPGDKVWAFVSDSNYNKDDKSYINKQKGDKKALWWPARVCHSHEYDEGMLSVIAEASLKDNYTNSNYDEINHTKKKEVNNNGCSYVCIKFYHDTESVYPISIFDNNNKRNISPMIFEDPIFDYHANNVNKDDNLKYLNNSLGINTAHLLKKLTEFHKKMLQQPLVSKFVEMARTEYERDKINASDGMDKGKVLFYNKLPLYRDLYFKNTSLVNKIPFDESTSFSAHNVLSSPDVPPYFNESPLSYDTLSMSSNTLPMSSNTLPMPSNSDDTSSSLISLTKPLNFTYEEQRKIEAYLSALPLKDAEKIRKNILPERESMIKDGNKKKKTNDKVIHSTHNTSFPPSTCPVLFKDDSNYHLNNSTRLPTNKTQKRTRSKRNKEVSTELPNCTNIKICEKIVKNLSKKNNNDELRNLEVITPFSPVRDTEDSRLNSKDHSNTYDNNNFDKNINDFSDDGSCLLATTINAKELISAEDSVPLLSPKDIIENNAISHPLFGNNCDIETKGKDTISFNINRNVVDNTKNDRDKRCYYEIEPMRSEELQGLRRDLFDISNTRSKDVLDPIYLFKDIIGAAQVGEYEKKKKTGYNNIHNKFNNSNNVITRIVKFDLPSEVLYTNPERSGLKLLLVPVKFANNKENDNVVYDVGSWLEPVQVDSNGQIMFMSIGLDVIDNSNNNLANNDEKKYGSFMVDHDKGNNNLPILSISSQTVSCDYGINNNKNTDNHNNDDNIENIINGISVPQNWRLSSKQQTAARSFIPLDLTDYIKRIAGRNISNNNNRISSSGTYYPKKDLKLLLYINLHNPIKQDYEINTFEYVLSALLWSGIMALIIVKTIPIEPNVCSWVINRPEGLTSHSNINNKKRKNDNNKNSSKSEREKSEEDSRNGIEDEDCYVSVTREEVSLICPLSRTLIKMPCRGACCLHVQCVDLHTLIQVCTQSHVWICPICQTSTPFSDIIIDHKLCDYIMENCHDNNKNKCVTAVFDGTRYLHPPPHNDGNNKKTNNKEVNNKNMSNLSLLNKENCERKEIVLLD